MTSNTINISCAINGRLDPHQFHHERIDMINNICLSGDWCRLKNVVKNVKTITTSLSADDIYIGLENIVSDSGDYVPTSNKDTISSAATFKKGDILFPKLRPYLNKVHRAEFAGKCSTEFHVLEAVGINPDFLTIILRSKMVLAQTKHLMTGNTLPRLQTYDVENIIIPLPPIEIQQQIVDIYTTAQKAKQAKEEQANMLLDSIDDYLLSKLGINIPDIDDDRNSVVKISSLIGQRFDPDFNNMKYQAVYSAMGSSIYPIKTLSEICDTIFQGVGKNETDDNTYTLLKVKNIQRNNKIDFEDTEFVKSVPPSKLLQYNDIISPFIGEAIRQIKFSVFKEKTGNYTVDNNTGVIRVKQGVSADYIAEYLCSTLGAHQIKRLIGGGVPFLGAHGAGEILVNLPPLNLQEEIALTISKIRKQANIIQDCGSQLINSAKKQIEKMILG